MAPTEATTKTKWLIDTAHSEIGFKVKHLMIANVRGIFKEYEVSIYTNGDDFMSAVIDFWVNPASIDTGDAKRDAHLIGADFFDVANFKEIKFIANTLMNVDNDGSFEMYGDLTIKGLTKRIILKVEFGGTMKDPWGNTKAAFSITGKINRKDWGLDWNAALETGGILLSDEVWLTCDVQLTKQVAV